MPTWMLIQRPKSQIWLEVVEVWWGLKSSSSVLFQVIVFSSRFHCKIPAFAPWPALDSKPVFCQRVERVKLPSTMATYQAKVNPYESPFSTSESTDPDPKSWQAGLSIVHSTSNAKTKPVPNIQKRTTPCQSSLKDLFENSLAESFFKKVSQLKAPKSKIKWSKGSWTTLFCPLPSEFIPPCWCQRSPKVVSRAQSLWQWTQRLD